MYYDVQINMSYMYRNKMYFHNKYLSNIPSFRIVILSLHKTNFDGEAGGGIEPVQILIIKIKYKIALHATALLFLLVTGYLQYNEGVLISVDIYFLWFKYLK